MTTDITELAQSMKAAAKKATPGTWALARDRKTVVSNQSHPIANLSDAMHRMLADGTTGQDAEFISLANPANILSLVEALEKAQDNGKVFQQSLFRQSLMYDVVAEAYEEAKGQVAKDAEIKARLCRESNSLFDRLRAAEKRIAELESKLANPVQLPKTNGYWTETEKAYEEAITLAKRQVRLAGFRCEGDE
ncbi:ead/Ea22-like family protein [Klebsiella grimontii]|uniref:ead/Ea22-like family protein n=1 Tax=Klebsiella grimontii TaxID=2058152 RepID=UPI000D7DA738|nr:ead/Ea22-like family protein [Klebsiella grimontii]AWT17932.1 hypothetical protein DMP75_04980 [Klebsiella michiganensis]QQQ25007.1 ead/Ea22-like family protein [Klebsiella grimontii]